jgi:hypothetical protein
MLSAVAASALVSVAITLPSQTTLVPQSASTPYVELMFDQEDRQARLDIIEMCAALEDTDNLQTYLANPKYMVEKVWYDYNTLYLSPLEELGRVLGELGELSDYVPQESLGEIDPENNQTETVTQVNDRLAICSALLDKAREAYQQEQARIQKEAEERAAQEAQKAQEKGTSVTTYSNGSGLTAASGVNWYNGRKETYYSSNVLYHYRTSEWWVDSEGFYRTTEGYYVVAASDMSQGTVFTTSKGAAMVLDSGCAAGVTDFYVSW